MFEKKKNQTVDSDENDDVEYFHALLLNSTLQLYYIAIVLSVYYKTKQKYKSKYENKMKVETRTFH